MKNYYKYFQPEGYAKDCIAGVTGCCWFCIMGMVGECEAYGGTPCNEGEEENK